MVIKKSKIDQLFEEKFHPYGLPMNKFMAGLKEENFNPFQTKAYNFQDIYDNKKTQYTTRTQIEHLLLQNIKLWDKNDSSILFGNTKTKEEDEDFTWLQSYKFNHKSSTTGPKSWFLFLKRLAVEFNIDYNQVALSQPFREAKYASPQLALSKKEETDLRKYMNLLHLAMEKTAPIPVINSLIKLGLDFTSPYTRYFDLQTFTDERFVKCLESTPLMQSLVDKGYPERISVILLENLLKKDTNVLFGEYKTFDFGGNINTAENFFTWFKEQDIKTRNNYGQAIYNIIKDKPLMIPQHLNNEEATVQDFLGKYSSVVHAIQEKNIISKNLSKQSNKLNNEKRRL